MAISADCYCLELLVSSCLSRSLIEASAFAACTACNAQNSSDGRGVPHLAETVTARPKRRTVKTSVDGMIIVWTVWPET